MEGNSLPEKASELTKGGSMSASLVQFEQRDEIDAPAANGVRLVDDQASFSRNGGGVSDAPTKQMPGLNANGTNGSSSFGGGSDPVARRLGAAQHEIPRWKRIFDVTCIVVSLPFWLPLMVLITLLIKLSSPGPAIYRQERVGLHGRRFMLYKFRTMFANADTRVHEEHFERLMRENAPMTKLDASGDPRFIPRGRFLRASGLDELPQIFNILCGEMSIVGPRPSTVKEFSRFGQRERGRTQVLPGLTGYWQVNGKNGTTFRTMIDMDLFYASNASFCLDLRILARTLPEIIKQVRERKRIALREGRDRRAATA